MASLFYQKTTVTWTSNLGRFEKTFEQLGVILKGVGDVVPIVGAPLRILARFCTGKDGKAEERQKIMVALENLLENLETTYQTLNKYTDDDKKESPLTLEVKTSLKACSDWGELIEKKNKLLIY